MAIIWVLYKETEDTATNCTSDTQCCGSNHCSSGKCCKSGETWDENNGCILTITDEDPDVCLDAGGSWHADIPDNRWHSGSPDCAIEAQGEYYTQASRGTTIDGALQISSYQ